MQKDDKMKENVPDRRDILRYIGGVSLMSIIPKTVRLRAAMMPGKEASTIGFMKRSSTSSDTIPEWTSGVYTAVLGMSAHPCGASTDGSRTVLYEFADYVSKTVGVERSDRRNQHGIIADAGDDELSRMW